MFDDLLRLYENACVNETDPKSLFAETQLFNESWLLTGVLSMWKDWKGQSRFPFLPIPEDASVRTAVQLYTCFKETKRPDDLAEKHTHADGVAGHFKGNQSKSGIEFRNDLSYLSAFEAKMYSPYSPVKNAKYCQASRTIACMIHAAIEETICHDAKLFFVTLYPEDNRRIDPSKYSRQVIENEIAERVTSYKSDGRRVDAFERNWRPTWNRVDVQWVKWEEVVEEINNTSLTEFYKLCKTFGKKKAVIKEPCPTS